MSVEARAFLRLLQAELDSSPDDARAVWNDNKYWTRSMLGDGATRKQTPPDWGAVGRVGAKLGYRLQAEYFRVDQIWYSEDPPPDWRIEAYIEHENAPRRLNETVRKLLSLGPGLKVAIAYLEKGKEEALKQVADLLRDRHGTSPDTRLLIVFGFLDDGSDKMRLKGYEFDGLGRRCDIRPQVP